MLVLFDQPVPFSTGVRANSILASNGSFLRDSSKKSCERPTPYERTVVITKDAKKTPAITAKPRSLPRQALKPARRSFPGVSVTLCIIRLGKLCEGAKSEGSNCKEVSALVILLPLLHLHPSPKQNEYRML